MDRRSCDVWRYPPLAAFLAQEWQAPTHASLRTWLLSASRTTPSKLHCSSTTGTPLVRVLLLYWYLKAVQRRGTSTGVGKLLLCQRNAFWGLCACATSGSLANGLSG